MFFELLNCSSSESVGGGEAGGEFIFLEVVCDFRDCCCFARAVDSCEENYKWFFYFERIFDFF